MALVARWGEVDVSEWEPATDAEVAMRDALRTDDQESYFRILAGVDLLLPVSADALAGLAPLGWGTWSTGGRTHLLAFTSPSAPPWFAARRARGDLRLPAHGPARDAGQASQHPEGEVAASAHGAASPQRH